VSERATLLAVAAIVAVSVGEVARGQYFNPADFPSLGPIPFGGGQFNTDTATAIFNGPGGTFTVQGVVADGVAVFTFDSIPILGASVTGTRPLAVLSKGDLTASGLSGLAAFDTQNAPGAPGGGGSAGGAGGPGSGFGFGGFNGSAGSGGLTGGGSPINNPFNQNGGGGGGVELGALGRLVLGGTIDAYGGSGRGALGFGAIGGGGGGGGGGVILLGDSILFTGSVSAQGGGGGPSGAGPGQGNRAGAGGGGGGGLVDLIAGPGGVDFQGTINVRGGNGGLALGGPSYFGGGGNGGSVFIDSQGPVNLAGQILLDGGTGTPPGASGSISIVPEPSALCLTTILCTAFLAVVGHRRLVNHKGRRHAGWGSSRLLFQE
jgi:hypothetical protein